MWHVRAREKKQTRRVRPPRAREKERTSPPSPPSRSVQRGLSWSASDKATIALRSLCDAFHGGGKKKKKSLGNFRPAKGNESSFFFRDAW